MDIVNFDALKAQGKVLPAEDVNLTEDYFLIGKRNVHYTTNSQKATEYPVFAIKAGDVMGAKAYKVYSALLTQTGADAPTATVLENTLGVTPIWYYQNVGTYYAESFGTFTEGKTVIMSGLLPEVNNVVMYTYSTLPDQVFIRTVKTSDGIAINENLVDTFIEIRVYN
jgi:hypothetical protein